VLRERLDAGRFPAMRLLAFAALLLALLPVYAFAQIRVASEFAGASTLTRAGNELLVADQTALWRVQMGAPHAVPWVSLRNKDVRAVAVDGALTYVADAANEQLLAFNRAGESVVLREDVRATALAVDRSGALFWLGDQGLLHMLTANRHEVRALRIERRFAPGAHLAFDGQNVLVFEPDALWVRTPVGELQPSILPEAPVRHAAAQGAVRWFLGTGWVKVVHPGGTEHIAVPEDGVQVAPGFALDFFLLTPDALWHWPAPASLR